MAFVPIVPVSLNRRQMSMRNMSRQSVCHNYHVQRQRYAVTASASDKAALSKQECSPLSEAQQKEWERVQHRVCTLLSVDERTGDKIVSRAFGWATQKFWRGRKKNEAPSLDVLENSLKFLMDVVEIKEATLPCLIMDFPEVIALDVSRMQDNVNFITKTYPYIKGERLTRAVLGNPAVLGYDFDCEGDCKSECARCWAQF